jgi:H+/Cl- antiporter ClcA
MRGIPLQPNPRRPRIRSWAERHHFAIGLVLTLIGLAAVGALQFLGVSGSLATLIGAFAAFALLFGPGFRRNRGPTFPPSEINRQNRWKYLLLTALLWGALFLIWWYRVRPLARR